jgi:hypothetical protein
MTTEPVVPVPAPKPAVVSTVSRDITWIRAHVLILLLSLAMIAGISIGTVELVEHFVEQHDIRAAAAQQAREGIDTATQKALMDQLAQYRTEDAAKDAAQTALISSLVASMAQQRAQTAKQVTTDASLDVQAAAARLAIQTNAAPGEVTVANGTTILDLPIARKVVASLDLLPQAQNDVINLTAQLGAQTVLTTDAQKELATVNQVIAADKVELIATVKADDATCKVTVNAAVDAQAKKDEKRGIWVAIGSFIGGVLVGHRL